MRSLDLKTSDGVTIAVPADLASLTTCVLLEQERWFEKEIDFLCSWLRPGMTVIDIGANLGIYSLLAARRVGETGHVFAYEPGSEAAGLLERSRKLNAADNMQIFPLALSDGEREGRLVFGNSSELNALGNAGTGETVHIVSLDGEDAGRGWPAPDFVKIDAEGEEERILTGGTKFFARHSPLVMFEVKAGDRVNDKLRALFPSIGYRLFRQLAGAPVLVPDDLQQPLDPFELNLFAAKPDRIESLSRDGFLVEAMTQWMPAAVDRAQADAFWRSQQFAPLVPPADGAPAEAQYHDCLAAYAFWRDATQPLSKRAAALHYAMIGLRTLCARAPTMMRLSTWARVAWEWGARVEAIGTLDRLLQMLRTTPAFSFDEPFWPAHPRFDAVPPADDPRNWFSTAAHEQMELASSFTSIFVKDAPMLNWLSSQPLASTEMERRRVLRAARARQRPAVPARLCQDAPDHLNADIWRKGRVPETVAKQR